MPFDHAVAKFKALLAIANKNKLDEQPGFTGYEFTLEHPSDEYPKGRLLYPDNTDAETKNITMILWAEANDCVPE